MSSTVEQAVSELSVPVPWGEIRGKVWGPDHGYPVLCLHGWLDNCGTFKTLIPLLPKGLQWKKFSIMGHSMGGNVAGMFSALYPEMVDAVILLDSFGFISTDSKNLSKVMRQGMDEMLHHEKKTEEKKRVYTYEKAVERLSAANPTLSEQSVRILLERGLVQVEGGFVFSRDLRLNFKNIPCISPEQSLEMQSKIQASVLVVLGDKGFAATFPESNQQLPSSKLLKAYRDRNHTVVTVSGDHHVHLNDPEAVAPLVSDFLRNKVLSQQLLA
ncbi:serine hydrolase-like protein isoform X6 [Epinephelus fuscoguttatus]|uniref:serine hydrolase-like protein isoform X6 n=1 Tax=Epinephelus fuscoguttatus TaxID=293821 RepID=UPI0020D0F5ED|nr:serine hydrolase-like protein isoform X6 [Epinephelus fuscoguttatus]